MNKIKIFTFNPFSENTYIIAAENGECVIIDPGCADREEEKILADYISGNGLKPVKLLNTHCHIDHILGNVFCMEKYGIELYANKEDIYNIKAADAFAESFGVRKPGSPPPTHYLREGDTVVFGNVILEVLFTPGHSAGHVVFYNRNGNYVIGGDVLFRESIGRTDLPGGNYAVLIRSITEKMFGLPDDTVVYPGHGPETTIGHEKVHNPFLNLIDAN